MVLDGKTLIMPTIAFRVDASLDIGTGHVMRCLTLADALASQEANCVFICREHLGHLADVIRQKGYICHLLPAPIEPFISQETDLVHADWLGVSWQEDAEETQVLLTQSVDWLVVDHYALDTRWQSQLKPCYHRLMVIDDLADRQHCSDVLLDQTFGRQASDYQALVPESCQLLLGSGYALLRPEFAQWREASLNCRRHQTKIQNILISMGGVDAHNHTAQILEAINPLSLPENLQLTVVLGSTAPHLQSVQTLAKTLNYSTQVLSGVSNMAELMINADLAIGAAGSTTWERACLGLPSLLFCLAENQRTGIEAVAKQGSAWFVRDMNKLASALQVLFAMPERIAQMQTLASQLTDGRGVEKVTRLLLQPVLTLRPVTLEDSQTLFAWRNHPSIRAVSLQKDELVFEQHHRWLSASLQNSNRVMWIACMGDTEVGMIRFDRTNEASQEVEVSLYLAPDQMGKGLGGKLLEAGEQKLLSVWEGIERIVAQVLPSNKASMKLFAKAQYQQAVQTFYKQVIS